MYTFIFVFHPPHSNYALMALIKIHKYSKKYRIITGSTHLAHTDPLLKE